MPGDHADNTIYDFDDACQDACRLQELNTMILITQDMGGRQAESGWKEKWIGQPEGNQRICLESASPGILVQQIVISIA